jgi:hypothetical protein
VRVGHDCGGGCTRTTPQALRSYQRRFADVRKPFLVPSQSNRLPSKLLRPFFPSSDIPLQPHSSSLQVDLHPFCPTVLIPSTYPPSSSQVGTPDYGAHRTKRRFSAHLMGRPSWVRERECVCVYSNLWASSILLANSPLQYFLLPIFLLPLLNATLFRAPFLCPFFPCPFFPCPFFVPLFSVQQNGWARGALQLPSSTHPFSLLTCHYAAKRLGEGGATATLRVRHLAGLSRTFVRHQFR